MIELGAKAVGDLDHRCGDAVVLADVDGNEFCLVAR